MENTIFFKKLAAPALVFALFFSLCAYGFGSFTAMIAAFIGLVAFIHISLYLLDKPVKKLTYLFDLIIIGFAISDYFNTIRELWTYNRLSLWITTIAALIYAFYDDREWGFGRQIRAIWDTFISALKEIPSPFKGIREYGKEGKGGWVIQVVIALCITIPVVAVLTVLLVHADVIFKRLVDSFFEEWNFGKIISIAFHTFAGFIFWYCLMRALKGGHAAELEEKPAPNVSSIIGVIFTGSISVLYLIFSVIQILGLFAGEGVLTLPASYTYSQYAREGFFQLLAVCALNLLIVLICRWCFEENKVIRVFLMIICAATYIMLASATFRMSMYVGAYGLTRLRFATYAGLIVIAFLLAEIIISVYRKRFPLYRVGLFTALIGYLALSLCQMDYWIDNYNVTLACCGAGSFFV